MTLGEELVRRRSWILALLSIAAVAGTLGTTRLETRFEPEALVSIDPAVRAERSALEQAFGASRSPVVVLVDGRASETSLVSDAGLASLHALAGSLRAQSGSGSVEGLTTSRFPTAEDDADDTLDEVDASSDEDLLGLLHTIVDAEPARFPSGMLSISAPVSFGSVGRVGHPLTHEEAARARGLLTDLPLLRRRLMSSDGRVALLAVFPGDGEDGGALVARLDPAALEDDLGVRASVRLAGLDVMRAEMVHALRDDQVLLIGLAVLGTLVVLIVGVRSAAGVLLPLGAVGIGLVLVLGAMAVLGLPLDLLTNMLPPLLLTIGLADSVHIVLRHREIVADEGLGPAEAAAEVARRMWLPCFVTSFTTAVGFAALAFADAPALRTFGILAATATMVAYVVTMLFVPAALPLFARERMPARQRERAVERALLKAAQLAASRSSWTIAAAAVVGASSIWMARDLVIESRLLDQFARDSEVAQACATLEGELDGFRSMDLGLFGAPGTFHSASGMAVLDAVATRAASDEAVLRASTVSELAHEVLARLAGDPEARVGRFRSDQEVVALLALLARGDRDTVRTLVTDDGAAARIEIRVRDVGAGRTLALIASLRAETERLARSEGLVVRTAAGGEAYVASHGLERIVHALGGLGVAIVVIFLAMALLFRSPRLGLIAVPPNALPLLVTVAYMVWRGIPLHAATVIVFTVTVGLAVDGSTHVVSRFRDELRASGGAQRDAVLARTIRGSGRAVLFSSVTLMVGYVALLGSRFEPVRLFGELSLVAIASATVSQTFVLPAMLARWGFERHRAQSESRPSSEEVNAASSGK